MEGGSAEKPQQIQIFFQNSKETSRKWEIFAQKNLASLSIFQPLFGRFKKFKGVRRRRGGWSAGIIKMYGESGDGERVG